MKHIAFGEKQVYAQIRTDSSSRSENCLCISNLFVKTKGWRASEWIARTLVKTETFCFVLKSRYCREDVAWWELQLGIFQQATDDMPSSVGALEYLHSNSSLSLSLHVTYNQFVKYIELAPFPSEWASQECNWVSSRLTWLNTWCHVHQDWLIGVTHIYFQQPENTEI